MSKSVDELEAAVRQLEDELARMRQVAGFTLASGNLEAGLTATIAGRGSIVGLEQAIATVDRGGGIAYVNNEMARFLGAGDRKSLSGKNLLELDHTPLGDGFLGGL